MAEAQAAAELPRYRSHKIVSALKIFAIEANDTPDEWTIVPAEEGYAGIIVDGYYMRKHEPQVGGYFVVYEDGYRSWSPAEAFEAGYRRITDGEMGAALGAVSERQSVPDVMRAGEWAPLTAVQKTRVRKIKAMGNELHALIDATGPSRECSIAKTELETAIMWAVRGVTAP